MQYLASPRKETDTTKGCLSLFLCSAQNRTHLRDALFANLQTIFSARGSHTSPRSARGIAVARRYTKRFAHQVGAAKSFNPRTAFPYLFAARDNICALRSCSTDCIFYLLAWQYTATGGMHQNRKYLSSGAFLYNTLKSHKRDCIFYWFVL